MSSSHPAPAPAGFRSAIAGIGVDLIEIDRIRQVGDLPEFLRQLLTERELSEHAGIHADPVLCATLFTAKEAVLKALECGVQRGASWHDVEITADFRAILSGGVGRIAEERSVKQILITPSRTGRVAMALAIAET